MLEQFTWSFTDSRKILLNDAATGDENLYERRRKEKKRGK